MPNFETLENGLAPQDGFNWGANYPYIRPVWVQIVRVPKGQAGTFPSAQIGDDVNPSSIIFECMTDMVWGMGCPTDLMDTTEFTGAATTLGNESFGMSLMWTNQSSVEEFIDIVLEHIDGVVFTHPNTGLQTIRLIRNDYDVNTLREVNPDNAELVTFQRRGLGETINEVVCTYTNPENEQQETVTLQALGNIARQGSVISTSVNYFGVRNRDLAMRLCARELRRLSTPTATTEVRLNREFWDVLPGDVLKMTWPDYGMQGVVMRVAEVDYGKPKDSMIKVKMAEDIFSLPILNYTVPPGTAFKGGNLDPAIITNYRVVTLPPYMAEAATGVEVATAEYPEAIMGILATTRHKDTSLYNLGYEKVLSTGALEWSSQGERDYVASGLVQDELPAEPTTLIPETPFLSKGLRPVAGSFIWFDFGDETADEIAQVETIDQTGATLKRGVLDTVPRLIPKGTKFWVLTLQSRIIDRRVNSAGQTLNYRLLMQTSNGSMAMSSAPIISGTASDRPHLPARPANVKVQGVGFGTADLTGLTQANVTWGNRNRTTETALVLAWTDGDVTPEAGQTTTVRALDDLGAVLAEYTGLTGTSYTLDLSPFGAETSGFIEVAAEKDGFESLQSYRLPVTLDGTGPITATYWRINITDSNTGDSFSTNVAELQFRETAGVSEVPSGGTAFASSENGASNPAEDAFDGDTTSVWAPPQNTPLPQSVGYQFAATKAVVQVSINSGNTSSRAARTPTAFEIQFSNDGVNWNTARTVNGEPAWSINETRTYSV